MSISVYVNWLRNLTYAPSDTAGLVLSWDADDFAAVANGTGISTWTSGVGTATAINATSSQQPTRQTVDGLPVVRFDGTNDRLMMTGDGLTATKNVSGVTVFMRLKSSTTSGIFLGFNNGTVSGNHRLLMRANTTWTVGGRRTDAEGLQSVGTLAVGTTATTVLTGWVDYTNNDATIYVNGVASGASTSMFSSGGGSTSNTNSLSAAIGSSASQDTFAACDISKILVYNRALTVDERETVEAYLIAASLAADDVSSLIRPNIGAVQFEYGRDQATALAPTVAGRGSLVLSNRDQRFSPRNTNSPLYGYLKPSRAVKATRTIAASGGGAYSDTYSDAYSADTDATYTLFQGHTDDNPIQVDRDTQTVTLSLVDSLADFRSNTITTPLYSGIRTGVAIGYVLDAAGWPAEARDLDSGATVIPWWWEDNTDALTALEKLIRSEGPPALLTMSETGGIVFKDRHHRLRDAASLTSQQTWRAAEGSSNPTIHRQGFSYDEAWRNIVNAGSVDIDVRTPRELQDVWTSDANFTLVSGESRDIIASSSDPFYDAVTPVDGVDYESVTGSINVKLSQLSGGSTIITMTAVGGTANIRGLKLRARPVQSAYTVHAAAENPGSIVDYGRRSFPGDLPWCSPGDAQAVIDTSVGLRAQPVPIITARFMVARSTYQIPVLVRDLSDRVTVVETELNLDDDFYIENIAHELTGEHDHAVTFGVEAAPIQPTPVFQLNTAGAGANQGHLSNPAIYPANLLILNSSVAGHRVGQGVCAY